MNTRASASPGGVLHLIDSFGRGGSEIAALRTVKALMGLEEQVVVHLQADGPLRREYEALGLPLIHLEIGSIRSPRSALALWRLAGIARRQGVAVVHAHDYYANIVAAAASLLMPSVRLVVSKRWIDQYVRPFHKRLDEWAYRRADLVLANSERVAATVRAAGVAADHVGLLPNFFDDASDVRPSVRPPGDTVVVGMVSRLAAVKNHDLALRALVRARASVPGLRMVICGDGEMRDDLTALVSTLGLVDVVEFAGQVPAGPASYADFDIYLLTSTSEGSPNSVLEAMVAGKPVVATAVGGVPELVREGVTGSLVPSGDVDAVAAALVDLAVDHAMRARMGAAAHASVDRYRQSRVIEDLRAMYRGGTPASR